MIVMRDSKGELSSMFDWVDIHTDTLNSNKVDKKTVRDQQGSMFTPTCQSGRQVVVLPEPIANLSLKVLENSIGRITDSLNKGEGKALFLSIMSKLTKVMQTGHEDGRRHEICGQTEGFHTRTSFLGKK